MKIFSAKWLVLASAVLVLGACGGGGGGSDGNPLLGDSSMTVNVASQSTATTTNTYTGSLTTTPALFGAIYSGVSYTQAMVEMSGPSLQVVVNANMDSGLGTYPIDLGTWVRYAEMSSGTGTVIYGATSGTVTITSYGNKGTPIVGSFDSIVTNGSNSTDTKKVWGSFSMNRVM